MPNVRIFSRTTVFGWYDGNVFGAVESVQKNTATVNPNRPVERIWRIAAKQSDPRLRRGKTPAGFRRQRYSRRHDGRRHALLSQPAGHRTWEKHCHLH